MKKNQTQKTLSLLLSGKLPESKKFAGKHVMVVKNKIIPLREGEKARKDFDQLKKKYKEPPILVFVPRRDVSYILMIWK